MLLSMAQYDILDTLLTEMKLYDIYEICQDEIIEDGVDTLIDYIYDQENEVRMEWKDFFNELTDAIAYSPSHYGLTDEQANIFYELIEQYGITDFSFPNYD